MKQVTVNMVLRSGRATGISLGALSAPQTARRLCRSERRPICGAPLFPGCMGKDAVLRSNNDSFRIKL